MKLKPLFNNILVERIEEDTKTKGGIIIPDTAKEKPSRGKVIAVGAGLTLENGTVQKMSVTEGDTILFSKWGGVEVKLDGTEYLIMKETDLLGIIE